MKELGLYDSSLIIITADHGEMLGEHGESTHGYFIYENAIRVPLVVKAPGGGRGKRVAGELAGVIDIVPTVCGLLGISSPAQVQGEDLSRHITGRASGKSRHAGERYYYCESLGPTKHGCNPLLGVVTGRWKYIQTTRPELYDLDEDPGETKDLVKEHPQRAHLLQGQLKAILSEQSYKGASSNALAPDAERMKRLESLGYVARVSAREIPEFDKSKPDPKDLIPLHAQAVKITTLTSRKRFKEARSLCEKALEEYPQSAYFHHRLGNISLALGDVDEAIVHFSKSISLALDNSVPGTIYDAHHLLTKAYFRSKRFEEAIVHLSKALRDAPDEPRLHGDLGYALAKVGRLDEAIKHYKKSLAGEPEEPGVHNNLAYAYSQQAMIKQAIFHWNQALRIKPDWASVLNNLAWLKAARKNEEFHDPAEAVRLAERACKLTEYKKPNFLDTLSVAYAAADRFPEAIKTAEKALALARDPGQKKLADEIQVHLKLFKQGKPFLEPAPSRTE